MSSKGEWKRSEICLFMFSSISFFVLSFYIRHLLFLLLLRYTKSPYAFLTSRVVNVVPLPLSFRWHPLIQCPDLKGIFCLDSISD